MCAVASTRRLIGCGCNRPGGAIFDRVRFVRSIEGATIAILDLVVYSEVVRDASLTANVGHFRVGEAASPVRGRAS